MDDLEEVEEEEGAGGFVLKLAGTEVTDGLSDYQRHVGNGAWEKAFRSLEAATAADAEGLVPEKDGFFIPVRQRLWQLLTEMPGEGRAAYKLFYDAKARQLAGWTESSHRTEVIADLEAAKNIYFNYFLTSAGDEAANTLGDAAFEQGRFREADMYWKAILDFLPDTELSELKVLTKRAVALRLAGETGELEKVTQTIAQRFAGHKAVIGGKEVEPLAFVAAMKVGEAPSLGGENLEKTAALTAPAEGVEPLWQVRFMSPGTQAAVVAAMRNWWGGSSGLATHVPPYVADGQRLYFNWLGVCFAVDATTGKMLWTTGKFSKVKERMQMLMMGVQQDTLVLAGDTLLVVARPAENNDWQSPSRLTAYDAATGVERWKSQAVAGLEQSGFAGKPLVVGERLLAVTHPQQQGELKLVSMSLKDGKQEWSMDLGQAKMGQNPWGVPIMPGPMLHLEGATLYVLTNNGGLLAVDIESRKMAWVLSFTPPVGTGQGRGRFFFRGGQDLTKSPGLGSIESRGGVLYFKETSGPTLYAFDPVQRRILWKRPVNDSASIVGFDDDRLYMAEPSLVAIDLNSKSLQWSASAPVASTSSSVVIGEDRVVVFTGRGLFEVSKKNGDTLRIFRGHDLDSSGGVLAIHGDKYLCISNTTVTAYPLPTAPAPGGGG